jgi:hypothetical protein
MKKNIMLLLAAMVIVGSCTKDEDKWPDAMKDKDAGSAMPFASFSTPKIFDVMDMDQTAIAFVLDVNATNRAKSFNKVVLEKSFNGGPFVLHDEYLPADLPASIKITINDALQGIEGVTRSDLKGGDFFDWRFTMDFPYEVNYQNELLGTFPNFRSFLASSPDGFQVEGKYTMDLVNDPSGLATERITGYAISLLPGTARSQYLLQDITCGIINQLFGVGNLAYRMYYIGDNNFLLHGGSEEYPNLLRLSGTVKRNPANGVITVDAAFFNSCCNLNGLQIAFTLTPE